MENKSGIVPTLAVSCEDFEKIKKSIEEKDKEIEKLNNKLKKIYEIVHYNCYYPELENYSNDLDDDDIKEIIKIIGGK